MKYPILLFLFIISFSYLNADQTYYFHNSLPFAIEKEPVYIKHLPNSSGTWKLVEVANGKIIPSQIIQSPNGQRELLTLPSLKNGESRKLRLEKIAKAPDINPTSTLKMAVDDKGLYNFSNALFSFTAHRTINSREHIFYALSHFKYSNSTIPVGISQERCFQVGAFLKTPKITTFQGELAAGIILSGESEVRYHTQVVTGSTTTRITIYKGKTIIDHESVFIPDANFNNFYLWGTTAVSVDAKDSVWKMSSIANKTKKRLNVDFGVPEKNWAPYANEWVAGIGPKSSFSYAIDNLGSSFNAKPGVSAAPWSNLKVRVWNFKGKGNYIETNGMGINFKKGVPSTFKARLSFYPETMKDDTFAEHDDRIFENIFLVKSQIKSIKFSGGTLVSKYDKKQIRSLLKNTDLAIVAGKNLSAANLALTLDLAKKWKIPMFTETGLQSFLNSTSANSARYQRHSCDELTLIIVGGLKENEIIRCNNYHYGFTNGIFPGSGKGRIAVINGFLSKNKKVIYVGGDDAKGTSAALKILDNRFHPPEIVTPAVRVLPPESRIGPWTRREFTPPEINTFACRGETVSTQTQLFSPVSISNLKAISTLTNEKGSTLTGQVRYIQWTFPKVDINGKLAQGEKSAFSLTFPENDALLDSPPKTIEPSSQVGIWVDYDVPQNSTPGMYKGFVNITCDRGSRKIPVSLKVSKIQLPEKWAMGFFPMCDFYAYNKCTLKLYLGIAEDDEKTFLNSLKQFGSFLARAGANTTKIGGYDIKAYVTSEGKFGIDFSEWEKNIKALRDGGFEGYFQPRLFMRGWKSNIKMIGELLNIDQKSAQKLFNLKIYEWLKKNDLLGKVVMRVGDEPGDISKWVAQSDAYKETGFVRTVCHNKCDIKSMRQMIGHIDMWCPNWLFFASRYSTPTASDDKSVFNENFIQERKKAGDKVWTYACSDGSPYACLTDTPTEIPFLFWDSYMKGAEGVGYYGGGYWSHNNPTKYRDSRVFDVYRYKGTWPGGSYLVYPDATRHRVISSQRWELFRDAQEDLKLFELFKKKFGKEKLAEILSPVLKQRFTSTAPYWLDDIQVEKIIEIREKIITSLQKEKI